MFKGIIVYFPHMAHNGITQALAHLYPATSKPIDFQIIHDTVNIPDIVLPIRDRITSPTGRRVAEISGKAVLRKIACHSSIMQRVPVKNRCSNPRFDEPSQATEESHGVWPQKTAAGKVEPDVQKIIICLIPDGKKPFKIAR